MTAGKNEEKPQGVGIVAALAAAMGQVESVAKGDRNKHDG